MLREVVSANSGQPAPGPSTRFTPSGRGSSDAADWSTLPTPLVDPDDPQAGVILALGAAGPDEIIRQLGATRGSSVELDLWLARALIDRRRVEEASAVLDGLEAADPWEWRTSWYRGVGALAAGRPADAATPLRRVYQYLPGELAPKLALGLAAESCSEPAIAAGWYEIVSRTDPAFTSASFGLARCRIAEGDRAGAIAAYERVLDTSSAFVGSRVAEARLLVSTTDAGTRVADILRAAGIVEQLNLDREQRDRLTAEVLEAALDAVRDGGAPAGAGATVLGSAFDERALRLGLEQTYRSLARHAATNPERITLVDRANRVRPRTLL